MRKKNSLSERMNRLRSVEEMAVSQNTDKKKTKSVPMQEPAAEDSEEEDTPSVEETEESEFAKEQKRERRERRKQVLGKAVNCILCIACVYTAFLIYCAAVTTFTYDANGKVIPERMTRKELAERSEYRKLYYFYETSRSVYEQILILDYRLSAGEEDPYLIAPEYESMLETIDVLCLKTDAFHPDAGYGQVKNLLLSWQRDDIAVYLQNISQAISMNDAQAGENALQDKDRVYQDFSYITQLMATYGQRIKGMELRDIETWSPENYVYETINGVKNE